ncbi:MFS transporter [Corynebacterium endometrii]|uniref:4-hydroxybenzoate transporter PcaK n=1 Tax=Corynebacterium endometrii TaxID=2488819 RepID=A0A4P7QER7_9CORY|nr:aromatic acid/H+ symport family MFS transporter [Corynebacterium endometrii]QCB27983.1 4-hydroxybenzoate transporter PcaK [Corynebacterium endometrii]
MTTTQSTRTNGFTLLGISGRPLAAVLLGWFFVIFDGYDLIVYGTVQTRLIELWGITDGQAGTIGSTAFIGMALGAIVVGRLSDAIGRKKAIILSVLILSVFTTLCALAPNPWVFGALRFLAGLGLGGLVPSVNVMVSELVPHERMAAWSTVMMSGVPLGGSIAAILAQYIVPSSEYWGWRAMFLVALIALVVGLPLALKVFPNDAEMRALNGRPARVITTAPEATASSVSSDRPTTEVQPKFSTLFSAKYRVITFWFTAATFVTLFTWYGLGTWLPRLMQTEGYDFGAALRFTLALNLGAVLGSVITAWAGDKFGPIRAGIVAALLAGCALMLLLTYPPVWAVYVILIFAGVGTHGTQILIIAAVTQSYPNLMRGTALGWAMGVGRIGAVIAPQLAGLLLQWGLGARSNFLLFAAMALISFSCLLIINAILSKRQRSVA